MNQRHPTEILYLHMGPGFHAGIEREVFASRFPFVHFVDQPQQLNFNDLVNWTRNLVDDLYVKNENKPITIVAHSFGGQILKSIVDQCSNRISEIVLLSCAFNSMNCFERIGKKIGFSNFALDKNIDTQLDFIFQLSMQPGFSDVYWFDLESKQKYDLMAQRYPVVCVSSFISVFADYLKSVTATRSISESPFTGVVKFIYSVDDVLINSQQDIEEWKSYFPQLQIMAISGAGHHLLHEKDTLAELIFAIETV